MVLEEAIDGSEEGVADRLQFAGRIDQPQDRRQHRDRGQERNDHARARDLAKLGNAPVVGRQEAEEAGRDRHRGERKRHGDTLRRLAQRFDQIVVLEALGSIADAELDAEVDTETDEQHRERDR